MKGKMDFDEALKQFNQDKRSFIAIKALKIFCDTKDEKTALEALKILERVAQLF